MNQEPNKTRLQVWWIPQIPMQPFEVEVNSVREAKKLLDVLAKYDAFQFENRIKPDYANAGGLVEWDAEANEWVDWYNDKGEGIDDLEMEQLPQ